MFGIMRYISQKLNNPLAAERLAVELAEAGDNLMEFPYANPAYIPPGPLMYEYRKLLVHDYFMFYWVNEPEKNVTVARVIYAKRDYELLLK